MPRTFTFVIALVALSLTTSWAQSQPLPTSEKILATYAPKWDIPKQALAKHLTGTGVCLLHIRSDGTVARAEMIQSTGQPILDKATIDGFSKWRFIPSTVKKRNKLKVPITYSYKDVKIAGI